MKTWMSFNILFALLLSLTMGHVSSWAREVNIPGVVMTDSVQLFDTQGAPMAQHVYGQGMYLEVIEVDHKNFDWVKVRINNQVGYMPRKQVTTVEKYRRAGYTPIQASPLGSGGLAGSQVNVRDLPALPNTIVRQPLPPPQQPLLPPPSLPPTSNTEAPNTVTLTNLNVLPMPDPNRANEPYVPRTAPPPEYVPPTVTPSQPSSTQYISANGGLRLRASNNTNSESLGVFQKGTEVQVLSSNPPWFEVQVGQSRGWMHSGYLTSTRPPTLSPTTTSTTPNAVTTTPPAPVSSTKYISGSNVNFRKTADSNGDIISRLGVNTEVEVLGTSGSWTHVKIDGEEGYVWSDFVAGQKTTPSTAPAVAATTPPPPAAPFTPPANVGKNHCISSLQAQTTDDQVLIDEIQREVGTSNINNSLWMDNTGVAFQIAQRQQLTITLRDLPPTAKKQINDGLGFPVNLVTNADKLLQNGDLEFGISSICRENGRYVVSINGSGHTQKHNGRLVITPNGGRGMLLSGTIGEANKPATVNLNNSNFRQAVSQ